MKSMTEYLNRRTENLDFSMAEKMTVTIDKLPIKRLDAIEENGTEHFALETSQEEKSLALLRRIDFGMSIDKDAKKSKTSKEKQSIPVWPWQGLVENLQLAHQELSIVIDLINHVEANDAVTVVGMTRPKQLPSEVLSDMSIALSTKLQCFRHIGKYFKQAAKALDQQVAREARFYGALMRLQRNWKVKRQRVISAGPGGNAGFTIDLSDHTSTDLMLGLRTSASSTVCIEQGPTGMLAAHLPGWSSHSIHVGFQGGQSGHKQWEYIKAKSSSILSTCKDMIHEQQVIKQEPDKALVKGIGEDVDEGAKGAHSVLRDIQRAIFDEQVFELIIWEALYASPGVNVTGICENFLQLSLGPESALTIRLLPPSFNQSNLKNNEEWVDSVAKMTNGESGKNRESAAGEEYGNITEEDPTDISKLCRLQTRRPSPLSAEVFLQQIFIQNAFVGIHRQSFRDVRRHAQAREVIMKGKEAVTAARHGGGQEPSSGCKLGPLSHFCMTLSHRIYCYKVLSELENLVRVPYLHLFSHPTWHSRTTAWFLYLDIPQAVTHGVQAKVSEWSISRQKLRSRFHCKIVVHDESLTIEGEGTPNVGGLFKGSSTEVCSINEYICGLADLVPILLQQIASQLIYWLHEESLVVGMKVNRDFLSLSFQLDNSDSLALVSSIDQREYCINWWLILNDTRPDDGLVKPDVDNIGSENKRFLGPLPLEALHGLLMDLVTLCSNGAES